MGREVDLQSDFMEIDYQLDLANNLNEESRGILKRSKEPKRKGRHTGLDGAGKPLL